MTGYDRLLLLSPCNTTSGLFPKPRELFQLNFGITALHTAKLKLYNLLARINMGLRGHKLQGHQHGIQNFCDPGSPGCQVMIKLQST